MSTPTGVTRPDTAGDCIDTASSVSQIQSLKLVNDANDPQASARRQTSLGDYFPAELATVNAEPKQQLQQQRRGRSMQPQPPPRHRITRLADPLGATAPSSTTDDSGCCDADIEERKLRDCLAFTFNSHYRLQHRDQQQQQAQAFVDPFGLATLAAKVIDNEDSIVSGVKACPQSSLSDSESQSVSSMSSTNSEPPSNLDDADANVGDEEDCLFRAYGGSMFESSLLSGGSPVDRLLRQQQQQQQQRVLQQSNSGWQRRRRSSSGGDSDDRELFVGNLAAEVTNEDLVRVFSEFGPLKSVGIAKDSSSGACKGFGFLCFQQPELAEAVLESPRLFTLYGRVLRVDWRLKSGHHGNGSRRLSPRHHQQQQQQLPQQQQQQQNPMMEAEINADKLTAAVDNDPEVPSNYHHSSQYGDCQLFVGNLASDVTQGDLRQYFRRWGELLYCYVIRDEEGQSKRYGFITFKDPKVAEQLMQSRSSHVLKGKRLRFEMPKRSREEAFNLRQGLDTTTDSATASSPSTPTVATAGAVASTPIAAGAAINKPPEMSPKSSPLAQSSLIDNYSSFDSSDRLPVWLHMRLMSDKDQLILCLRKELGLCGLLAERRLRELGQARDREAQVMRVYVQQLEAKVKAQAADIDSLKHQLECRGEQVKLLTAKAEALAVEIVKAWGCAATAAAVAATSGGNEESAATANATVATTGGAQASSSQVQQQQPQQKQLFSQHRLRPDSGIGL